MILVRSLLLIPNKYTAIGIIERTRISSTTIKSNFSKYFATTSTTPTTSTTTTTTTTTTSSKFQSQGNHNAAIQPPKEDINNLDIEIEIIQDGSAILIPFPSTSNTTTNKIKSKFDAAWLWSNCPSSIHPTSGQRHRTPGDYFHPTNNNATTSTIKIQNASILPISDITNNVDDYDRYTKSPLGCCHSIGNVYATNDTNTNVDPSLEVVVCIEWSDTNATSSSQISYFNLNWLKRWRYDTSLLQERRKRTEIGIEQALQSNTKLFTIDYKSILTSNESLFHLLQAIMNNGGALISNTPCNYKVEEEASLTQLAKRLSSSALSHGSLYGNLFHVRSLPSAYNIAYTSFALPPHQDLVYYESIPGLQLLHCIEHSSTTTTTDNKEEGSGYGDGESILIDCMAAASYLREVAPHHFEVLCRVPATFVKQRDGVCMTYRRPHIVLSDDFDCEGFAGEIVSVNWAPPFEGPLSVPSAFIEPYYKAHSAFQCILDDTMPTIYPSTSTTESSVTKYQTYAKQYTWEQKLQPGEVLIFNNRRMLHGRRSFNPTTSKRLLVGCYTNIDDTVNVYRVLKRENATTDEHVFLSNVGNNTSMIP